MKGHISLNETQRHLVEANLNLITFVLRKTRLCGFDRWEDAYQIGSLGLMKAAYHFDDQRGITFSTFAIPCIVNELKMAKRHANRQSNRAIVASLQDDLPGCADGTLHLGDVIAAETPSPDSHLLYQEMCKSILDALADSDEKDALLLFRMMLEKRRQADIASLLGCSQSYVSRRQKRIRELIQQALL